MNTTAFSQLQVVPYSCLLEGRSHRDSLPDHTETTKKAMHHALLISEVLSCIFGYLTEDTVRHPKAFYERDTWKAGKRALAVLARTCRAFSEPALDALWHRLHSLEPFVLCLPARASKSYDEIIMGGALPLLNEEEWSIVLRYAPRVRELTLERELLSVKILQSLCFRTALPLPNLRKLRCVYEACALIASIRLLLSPSLIHLHVWLDGGDPDSSVLGLLEPYHSSCPNKFGAKLLDYQPDGLKKFVGYNTPGHPLLENLRVLELRIEDLSSIIPYFKLHHQPLEEVSLDFRALPTPEVFHEFFTALSSATRQRTLRRIRLHSFGSGKYGILSRPVDLRALGPLMIFNLRTFDVNLHNSVSLNDDELVRLVQGWPKLETFHFNQVSGWDYLPFFQIPTLKGLLHILDRCPKLRNVGMCVDARSMPLLSEDESLIRNTAITRLSLANSPVQAPAARVAEFLLEHLPSLVALPAWISFRGELSRDYRHVWKEVNKQIQEIRGWDSSAASSDGETDCT